MSNAMTHFNRDHLQQELRTPLDALRAALESIAASFDPNHPHMGVVERGIDQTVTLSLRVQNLIDTVAPLSANARTKEALR